MLRDIMNKPKGVNTSYCKDVSKRGSNKIKELVWIINLLIKCLSQIHSRYNITASNKHTEIYYKHYMLFYYHEQQFIINIMLLKT